MLYTGKNGTNDKEVFAMDLKSFREDKLKIKTQSAFAELIGVEQSSVSRWEKDPSSITFEVIQKILEKTGATFDELTGWKKPIPDPLDVEDTWKNVDFTKCTILDYIVSALEKLGLSEEQKKSYIEDLQKGVVANLVKPKVAIVGRSDTGKSTLINALLGAEKMPTAWTPTTSIAVYLKHISDRPDFIEEDAWVFSNSNGNENMWNERNLYDEEYCRSWKIASGGVEILRSFGTRQGENYDKEAGSAVIFLDAPILKTCDIVDLPGFGTETESDDNITFSAAQKADVIIYLSQANGFMRIEDITYLKRNISELPVWEKEDNRLTPLSNLFVVASQAHTVNNGNRTQLTEILDVGCKNLLKTLPSNYWGNRAAISGHQYDSNGYGELRSRFFAYTTDIPEICTSFNDSLTKILEALPEIINNRTKEFVKGYVSERKPNLENEIKKYEKILEERDRFVKLLEEIDNNELSRVKENDTRKKTIRSEIDTFRTESLTEFTDYIGNTINVDSLVAIMREKGVKNKKDDVELFGSTLQSMIQSECESILKRKSETLAKKTEDYITAYSESISKPFENNELDIDFNAAWAFATILSKLGMIGGFGTFLASSISGAFLLAGLGLSLGTSIFGGVLCSSIFGPIGIAFGLLVAGGLGLAKLFGGGWEKSIAKKIVSEFETNKFDDEFRKGIKEYWKQTEDAFNKASEKLDEEWNSYVNNLRDTVNSYDIEEIQRQIAILGNLSSFFDNIPL